MKKIFLLIGMIVVFITHLRAQTEFGLRVGVNAPSYAYGDLEALSSAKSILSFYVAGYVDARIGKNLHLYPEVSLQGKGARIVKSGELGGSEIVQRVNWVDFAFNFLHKSPLATLGAFYVGAGPYLGFAMNGENKYPDGTSSAVIIYKENAVKSIDYGANVLVGVKVGSRFSLNVGYRQGIANITYDVNKWSSNIKNRVFSLGAGVSL